MTVGLPRTSANGMSFSKRSERSFRVEPSFPHFLFVGEWWEEQGWRWLSRKHQVWHVRRSGGERAETLSVCEEFRIRQGGCARWLKHSVKQYTWTRADRILLCQ
jgi:hypothetical protein